MQNEGENPVGLDDIASWVLKKLAGNNYCFTPAGQEGCSELTICQWEEDFEQPLKPEEVNLSPLGFLNLEFLSKLREATGNMHDEVVESLPASLASRCLFCDD